MVHLPHPKVPHPHLSADETWITNDQVLHPTWSPPMADRIRTIEWGEVGVALGVALAASIAAAAVISMVLAAMNPPAGNTLTHDAGPLLIMSHAGVFFGFAMGALVLRRRTLHNPFLHALALVGGGLLVSVLVTVLDVALGFPLEDILPGGLPHQIGVVQFITGPWIIFAAALPAAIIGVAVVPGANETIRNADMRCEDPDSYEL